VEPTVQVAFVGIATSIVTTVGIVIVAMINNRKERTTAAESSMERTLRERITLRDEQIVDLKNDVLNLESEVQELKATIAKGNGV
jgi:uncharacterized protein YlxW (UPF0749 family)